MVTNNRCISILSSYTIIDSVLLYFNLVTVSFFCSSSWCHGCWSTVYDCGISCSYSLTFLYKPKVTTVYLSSCKHGLDVSAYLSPNCPTELNRSLLMEPCQIKRQWLHEFPNGSLKSPLGPGVH